MNQVFTRTFTRAKTYFSAFMYSSLYVLTRRLPIPAIFVIRPNRVDCLSFPGQFGPHCYYVNRIVVLTAAGITAKILVKSICVERYFLRWLMVAWSVMSTYQKVGLKSSFNNMNFNVVVSWKCTHPQTHNRHHRVIRKRPKWQTKFFKIINNTDV